ncbi:DUF5085 family protein [Paenibacillus pinisoli]|uniref:DUF5085 family protein n=1 Tax=Paenibacillus pinisoli TaxID=1276110 RepID=A0A3A6PIZ3_9BACL|nr:DUF5085 family protein [Paenibacillus pinisoli]RJX39128.1 DUF5085 family protein [Paenibacillus pinisoli]
MVLVGDSIRFTNVISKKYYYHFNDMKTVMESFINEIIGVHATVKGPLFYALYNVPLDEMMMAEFFMPVEEDQVELPEDMRYHSYYNIEDMLGVAIHKQFETATEEAYASLIQYMNLNGYTQITPIYHLFSGDNTMQYVHIKIGYAPAEEEQQEREPELVWKD